jgi:hypothetical protein
LKGVPPGWTILVTEDTELLIILSPSQTRALTPTDVENVFACYEFVPSMAFAEHHFQLRGWVHSEENGEIWLQGGMPSIIVAPDSAFFGAQRTTPRFESCEGGSD